MAETFAIATLTELTQPLLAVDPATLTFIPIRTGKHNTSYYVESPAGRYVLRIAPPDDAGFLFYERLMMRQEPDLYMLIRARTTIPVAEIVGYDFRRTHIDRDYLLMTALPGMPLSEAVGLSVSGRDRALRQVGVYLRQLHRLTSSTCLARSDVVAPPGYGYLGAHHPLPAQPDWAAAFHAMWHRLIDDVVACGCYTPSEAQGMRDLLEPYLHLFDRPVAPSLLHMDVWGQNILIDPTGNVTGIVDFDRALWGDPEIEFAVLDYCGISEPAFWEGYGIQRDMSPAAMIRRQFYLLYEIQKYMPIRVWRRNNPADAERYKQRSLALAAQLRATTE